MRMIHLKLVVVFLVGLALMACAQERVSDIAKTDSLPTTESDGSKDGKKATADTDAIEITVYKSPTCNCCTAWESHVKKAGFVLTSKATSEMTSIKKQNGVPDNLHSCHTALVDGYVIEGHVPASDIKKLLTQRPEVLGLAAPGMPANSPGMQAEGKKPSGYDVLSFKRDGTTAVYSSY